jgi:uroporphyrinogen decarboxylase
MAPSTPRQRVLDALAHKTPSAVPIDIGGTNTSSVVEGAYERLKTALGVTSETAFISRRSRTAALDDAIFKRLGSCVRPIWVGGAIASEAPDGSLLDKWGVTWKRSGDGHYNPVGNPLVDATEADLASYSWPDPDDPAWIGGLREGAERWREEGEYAIALSLPVAIVHLSQYLRGYDQYLVDLMVDQSFAANLMGRVADVYMGIAEKALDAVGGDIDVVQFGDDVAFQDRPMVRPDIYRKLIKPHHQRLIELIKSRSRAAVFYHCCGAVADLIPDFIDIGVDALNPVQVSATGMGDTARLKREFGRDITFWGAIDTQHTLPYGTPDDVRDEVRRRIEDLGEDGGFVVAAVHNIQDDVSPENIFALADAVREYGASPTEPVAA